MTIEVIKVPIKNKDSQTGLGKTFRLTELHWEKKRSVRSNEHFHISVFKRGYRQSFKPCPSVNFFLSSKEVKLISHRKTV